MAPCPPPTIREAAYCLKEQIIDYWSGLLIRREAYWFTGAASYLDKQPID